MKITICKEYEVNNEFLAYLFDNIDKIPDKLGSFENEIIEILSGYCEDSEYCKNVNELYDRIKFILK